MTEPRPSFWKRLKRPRLTLRVLMLAVLILGVSCGMYVVSARRQAQTVAELRRLGGNAEYEWEYRDGLHLQGSPQPWRRWLIEKLGPDFAGNVTVVYLSIQPSTELPLSEKDLRAINEDLTTRIAELSHLEILDLSGNYYFTDESMDRLAGLRGLRVLSLSGRPLDGTSLRHVRGMKQLQTLDLFETRIRDQDLANLADKTDLTFLRLSGNQLTDEGLKHLSGLTRLTTFDLRNTGQSPMAITSRGLSYLSGNSRMEQMTIGTSRIESLEPLSSMGNLKFLELGEAALTDQGLAPLGRNLNQLVILKLDGNRAITDAGLAHLSGLQNLEILNLSGASVKGPGLVELASLPKLDRLDLRWSKLDDEGLAKLEPRSKMFRSKPSYFNLQNTLMSDVGLARLLKIASPSHVFVFGIRTTPEGRAELQNEFPEINFVQKENGGWRPK